MEMTIEDKIKNTLQNSIDDYIRGHGGELIFRSFQDGIVYISMQGACVGCSAQDITLRFGIERTLRRAIPEVKKVVMA
ncbi:MAG: NifU family protein [Candidatus Kapaibacterium sp.]|jgi:Fe-S cluster biogenesis protein NfuA